VRSVEVRRSLALLAEVGGRLLRWVDRRGVWVARENVRVVLGWAAGEAEGVVRDAYLRVARRCLARAVGRGRTAPFAVPRGEPCVSVAFGAWRTLPQGVRLLDGGAPLPTEPCRLVLVLPDAAGRSRLWVSPPLPAADVLPRILDVLRASPGLYEWRRPLLLHRPEARLRDGVRYSRWTGRPTRLHRPAPSRRPPPAPP
jgi:hypothetical protein